MGLTDYFRKFIKDYAAIAKLLSDMLKTDHEFKFKEGQKRAFQKLKDILSKNPVLIIYNSKYETELHTDASKYEYGAVLMQKLPKNGQFLSRLIHG